MTKRQFGYGYILFWLILGSCMASINPLQAQRVFHIAQKPQNPQDLRAYVEILTDTSKHLTLQQVSAAGFRSAYQALRPNPDGYLPKYAYWSRISLHNTLDQDLNLIIYLGDRYSNYIEAYILDSQGTLQSSYKTGNLVPQSQKSIKPNRNYPKVPLALRPKQAVVVYVRSENIDHKSVSAALSLAPEVSFYEEIISRNLYQGLFQGAIWILIAYSFFIWAIHRDKVYLFYSLYLLCNALYFLNFYGFGSEWLYPESPKSFYYLYLFSTALQPVFYLRFVKYYADTVIYFPLLNRLIRWWSRVRLAELGLMLFVLITSLQYDWIHAWHRTFALVEVLFYMTLVYLLLKKRQWIIFYLILGTLFVNMGLVASLLLGSWGVRYAVVNMVYELSIIIEFVFFAIGLGHRARRIEKEQLQIKEELITLQKLTNDELEKKVQERTADLANMQREVQIQNRELRLKQVEFMHQTEILKKQKDDLLQAHRIISQQNSILTQYNEDLETKVRERTQDLENINLELIEHNNQLEQFAFIVAHNIRAPVARMIGLTSLIRDGQLSLKGDEPTLEWLSKTAQQLDEVISDLNLILDIRKSINQYREKIDLEKRLRKVLDMLIGKIQESEAEIILHLAPIEEYYGIAAYIESIFYNLISNAIKYKHPDRIPRIEISIAKQPEEQLLISVSDNGLGIDIAYYQEKLFGLYKRFHDHVEGKGLGLYLIKTQVEALGGRINLRSVIDQGSIFEISLPIAPPVKQSLVAVDEEEDDDID